MNAPLAPDHDAYWRLGTYETKSRSVLLQELQAKGYTFRSGISKSELVEVQQRLDRGLLHYGDKRITDKELLHFTENRRLLKPTANNRKAMVSVLMGGDETRVFERFVELPPELRERIYKLHISTFPEYLFNPTQPPITRCCKMLRREALPVFYDLTIFDMWLFFCTDGFQVGDDTSRALLRPCPSTSQFLQAMALHSTRTIRLRRFKMHIRASSMQQMLKGEGKSIVGITYEAQLAKKKKKHWSFSYAAGSLLKPSSSFKDRHSQRFGEHTYQTKSFSMNDIYRIRKAIEVALL
ncbi:hypothetical protein Slin15195_G117530 [Septoria linicola]|uniref:Uncharacterized protein n=1 Tax=Septoria linicola TaxID=215465 RepID=A0A9Q9B053_9PEZI|nr:hypothetical protein Slin15195_G117530 [Septoria linicola]